MSASKLPPYRRLRPSHYYRPAGDRFYVITSVSRGLWTVYWSRSYEAPTTGVHVGDRLTLNEAKALASEHEREAIKGNLLDIEADHPFARLDLRQRGPKTWAALLPALGRLDYLGRKLALEADATSDLRESVSLNRLGWLTRRWVDAIATEAALPINHASADIAGSSFLMTFSIIRGEAGQPASVFILGIFPEVDPATGGWPTWEMDLDEGGLVWAVTLTYPAGPETFAVLNPKPPFAY